MTNLVAEQVVRELDEIVKLDGGRLHLRQATDAVVELELDLTQSSCPECVLPKAMLLEIIGAKLAAAAPDVSHIRLHDPREPDPSDRPAQSG